MTVISTRMKRAAEAERERITRQRSKLDQQIATRRSELAALQAALRELKERDALLCQLTDEHIPAGVPSAMVLRGADIRVQAVKLLWDRQGRSPAHYRDWFTLLGDAGFVVLGERPASAFLTAITRSPIVRHGTEEGVYLIDPDMKADVERELAEARAEFADLATVRAGDVDRARDLRKHRMDLMARMRRLERAVLEAQECLS